jgi:outer membrane protein assembly factor BamB
LIYIWLELWWLNNKWSLSAFDIDTWEEKWRILYDDYVHCSPWYSEQSGLVVCSWNDWKFICKNADDDAILFELNLKESNKWWFWFSENWKKVYFWSFDKSLYCVDLIKKEVVWKFETWNIIYTKPLIIWNDIFFWWLDKFFYHIDHKWILKKKIRTFWKIFWEAIILKKGIIAFASNDSYIYVYNFEIEKNLFVIEHREKISSKLIFDNELWILYVNNFMNELFKYNIWWYL